MDDLFTDSLRGLLMQSCTPDVIRAIESGEPPHALWLQLEESGFANALLGEEAGGAGLSLQESFELLELCGAFAVPVPLAQTMMARKLLCQAEVPVPPGSISLGEAQLLADGSILCKAVPCGNVCDWVLARLGTEGVLLSAAAAEKSAGVFPLDADLRWPGAPDSGQRCPAMPDIRELQACIYSVLLAGALMSVLTRSVQYANERTQFGRAIGKFQAIQHQLSVMAEDVFAARMAAQIGCRSAAGIAPERLSVAVAKARTSEAAARVAALSHAVHGAIGFTHEFDLQLFTRRLHAWRQTGGSESYWHRVLGGALLNQDEGASASLDLMRAIIDRQPPGAPRWSSS